MSSHTPGPWRLDGEVVREQDTNDVIAEPGNNFGCINPSQVLRANAALIAAAPDQNEALEAIVQLCSDMNPANAYADLGKCQDIARAAIAKARGNKHG